MKSSRRTKSLLAGLAVVLLALPSCAGENAGNQTLTIYTSVTQETVDAVVAGFMGANPEAEVEVFRAPTGELTARIAAEMREGGLQADILWLTDPLSIQQYEADSLLRVWMPDNAESVPADYRTETFFGTRILNMVIIAGSDIEDPPVDWSDLVSAGSVAIPDPGFAGSAFGALAYFAGADSYGIDFYSQLRDAGAEQVRTPGDVVTGVAEGVYDAGMTLDFSARAAIGDGSPITLIWPSSGAIAIYSPIAVVDTAVGDGAESFVEFVLGVDGQQAVADTGWQPIRDDVAWDSGGPQVNVDWSLAFDTQADLLEQYRSVFGE